MGKFLVTGGCGFIGSHLVDALINRGEEVHVLDDLSTGKRENLNPKALFVEGKVEDAELLKTLFFNTFDGCFHMAAIASVEKSTKEWLASHQVNCSGSVALFEAASHQKVPVVYASSAAVYGANTNLPLREDEVIKPLTAYGVDKYASELHAFIASTLHEIPTLGCRFFNVYGPRQDPASPYSGVISIFIGQILEGSPLTINGTGQQVRDFIYVQDVVQALVKGMDFKRTLQKGADVYNICTGLPTNLLDLAEHLEKISGKSVEKIYSSGRVGDIQKSLGNPEKFKKNLSIQSQISLREGLQKTLESLRNERKLSHAS